MYPSIVLVDPSEAGSEDVLLPPVALASGPRNEAWLRDFLLRHPAVLPAAAIDPAFSKLIPVCRELRTGAGPLDCLFVTRFGGLVVVECKLWRNPQARREVIGQILDYAKEIAALDYAGLQRDISLARGERGTNILFDLVAVHHPDCVEAEFVDAVSRNLSRGRLMLLVAGDGIREGTESIVQYVSRYSGLHLTFGLVEVAGYELPDGRLIVQPRLLARTTNIDLAVVRVEGPGAELASIMTPEEADRSVGEDIPDQVLEAGTRRKFDPVTVEADRSWRTAFVQRIQFDDPAQATGSVGYGRVQLPLPVNWAWMTAYSTRSSNRVGNTLVLRGQVGEEVFAALEAERPAIDAELKAGAPPNLAVNWYRLSGSFQINASRTFPGAWSPDQEPAQLEWQLSATNSFVNVIRPKVLRLLSREPV